MKLTGGQIVVQTLIREGVPYIVGIPGHGTLGLSDALIGQDQLQVLQIRHEQAAVHLAVSRPHDGEGVEILNGSARSRGVT